MFVVLNPRLAVSYKNKYLIIKDKKDRKCLLEYIQKHLGATENDNKRISNKRYLNHTQINNKYFVYINEIQIIIEEKWNVRTMKQLILNRLRKQLLKIIGNYQP